MTEWIEAYGGDVIPVTRIARAYQKRETNKHGVTYFSSWIDTLDGHTYKILDLPKEGSLVPNHNQSMVLIVVTAWEDAHKHIWLPIVAWRVRPAAGAQEQLISDPVVAGEYELCSNQRSAVYDTSSQRAWGFDLEGSLDLVVNELVQSIRGENKRSSHA